MKPIETKPVFETGVFTLSLDFELIWGTLDHGGLQSFRRICEVERREVIDRLLEIFVEFEIPATWCIVGHLFLDKCEPVAGIKHPEIVRPNHEWCEGDWFEHDPHEAENETSVFVGRSLVEKIKNCAVPQEIGSHSFSHVIFSDAGCSRETADTELAECRRAAKEMGIEMQSFVFPRNEVGHLDVLREHGFTCYRGVEPHWYETGNYSKRFRRFAHLFDVLTAATPPVVLPEKTESGLWNIPGSAIYFPMHGYRKYIPLGLRTRRAVKGLNAAAKQKRIFHLWFHPTNMADEPEAMFRGLRTIFEHVARLRERGEMQILPMKNLI